MNTNFVNYENKFSAHHHNSGAAADHTVISAKLDRMAAALADGSLRFAKGLAALLGGGMALAGGIAGVSWFAWGCYLISRFAQGLMVTLPLSVARIFHMSVIQGADLIFGGIASVLVGITLLAVVAAALLIWKIAKSQTE